MGVAIKASDLTDLQTFYQKRLNEAVDAFIYFFKQ